MKKYNVVLSINESEVLKYYCQQEDIKFFRTEYGNDRYCQFEISEEQHDEIQQFLDDLEYVINDDNNLIAIFNHSNEYYSIVDCINDASFAGSFYDVVEELSNMPIDADIWIDGWFKGKIKRKGSGKNVGL